MSRPPSSPVPLLVATAAALLWAYLASHAYADFWHTALHTAPRWRSLAQPLYFWIDEGLMTVFFLVAGLEIRSEMADGVLSKARTAILPIVAATGGVLVPALIFVMLNADPPLRRGWAVPTATDIAFALGVLGLLGRRVPRALRVLLLTIAVADDIAAVVIIAIAYSAPIQYVGLIVAACGLGAVLGIQALGLRKPLGYVVPGFVAWIGLLVAGIHPTLAGIALGLLTPMPAATDLKDRLEPLVAYVVLPLFALASAGVDVSAFVASVGHLPRLVQGVMLGLAVGKPLGIVFGAWVCVKLRLCPLPSGVGWRHMMVLGCLGGIGFTMAIFLSDLAFRSEPWLSTAKCSVLAGSVVASLLGLSLGALLLPKLSLRQVHAASK